MAHELCEECESKLRSAIGGLDSIEYGLRGMKTRLSPIQCEEADFLIGLIGTVKNNVYDALGEERPLCPTCGSKWDNDNCPKCMERK